MRGLGVHMHHKICYSGQIEDNMGRICSIYSRDKNAYKVFVTKVQGEPKLVESRHKWKANIIMGVTVM
jgi:hypothetical protein